MKSVSFSTRSYFHGLHPRACLEHTIEDIERDHLVDVLRRVGILTQQEANDLASRDLSKDATENIMFAVESRISKSLCGDLLQ